MQISNKCYYALRAVFDLAGNYSSERPIKIAFIAARQSIPKRFLEVILNELRQGGFVESRRGVEGGYLLARKPETITIGEIIRFVDGDIAPVSCVGPDPAKVSCDLNFNCPYYDFWGRVRQAMDKVYEGTSLADILEGWQKRNAGINMSYEI
ncbi:MAG: Rrf2 family transcriptional regulator [Candidatus Glassbacteria bacterium]